MVDCMLARSASLHDPRVFSTPPPLNAFNKGQHTELVRRIWLVTDERRVTFVYHAVCWLPGTFSLETHLTRKQGDLS
jgi:hypothetical protein